MVRPGDTQGAQVGLAKAFLKTGKPELALSPLSKALEATPDDPKLLLLLGVTKDLAGRHWEAQAYYRDGLVRAPGNPALTVDLALSLALSGNYPNAIAVLQPLAMSPAGSAQERQTLALIYGLSGLLIMMATASLAAPPPVNPADAAAFMNQLWNRARELLNKKVDPAIKQARFRELFRADFDCPGIARFVLGRYWRNASAEEQQEFVRLFEDYVAFVYTARLSNLGGETFRVRGSRSDGDAVILSTDVISPGNAPPVGLSPRSR